MKDLADLDVASRRWLYGLTVRCLSLPGLQALLAYSDWSNQSVSSAVELIVFVDAQWATARSFSQRHIRSGLRKFADSHGKDLKIHFQASDLAEIAVFEQPRKWRLWTSQGVLLHGKLEVVFAPPMLHFLMQPLDARLAGHHQAQEFLATARAQLQLADRDYEQDAQGNPRRLVRAYDARGLEEVTRSVIRATEAMNESEQNKAYSLSDVLQKLEVSAPQLRRLYSTSTAADDSFIWEELRREVLHLLSAAERRLQQSLPQMKGDL